MVARCNTGDCEGPCAYRSLKTVMQRAERGPSPIGVDQTQRFASCVRSKILESQSAFFPHGPTFVFVYRTYVTITEEYIEEKNSLVGFP